MVTRVDKKRVLSPVFHQSPVISYGFTYIGLLIFIALMGIALAGTGMVWHTQARREKERELLFVGDQFRRAIGQYYERSPGGDKRFPQSLDDLLLDKRYPATQRYLRRVYLDPITGKADWGFLKGPEDRIVGVYSLSEDVPLKRAGFPANYEDFEGKESYREWRFVYAPSAPPGQPQPQQSQPAGLAAKS
jgi:type II secretory pathway pseudopilin PulG